jgi:hypothetical protein
LPEPPSSQRLLLIEPEFSLNLSKPKQYDDLADSEKHQLSEKIDAWAQKHSVDIKRFYFRHDRSSPTGLQRSGLTALERLINAQNEETRKQLLIPADIVQYLSRF